jgi:hypothetical protein
MLIPVNSLGLVIILLMLTNAISFLGGMIFVARNVIRGMTDAKTKKGV